MEQEKEEEERTVRKDRLIKKPGVNRISRQPVVCWLAVYLTNKNFGAEGFFLMSLDRPLDQSSFSCFFFSFFIFILFFSFVLLIAYLTPFTMKTHCIRQREKDQSGTGTGLIQVGGRRRIVVVTSYKYIDDYMFSASILDPRTTSC